MSTDKPVPEVDELSEAKRRLLAQRLKGISADRQGSERIPPRPPGARTPISADQYRIWLHASIQPDLPTYNEPISIQRRGTLDLALLQESFDRFLKRHEAWRTSFAIHHEEVFQVVHPEVRVKVEFADLSALPEVEREGEAKRLATAQARRPISLSDAPLFRAMVVRIAPDDHRLYMVVHHIICDGVSIQRTFLPELAAIYAALESKTEPQLPDLPLQYCDYAVWRLQQVNSDVIKPHVDYWRKILAGELPVLRLPTDRARPAVISHRGAMEHFIVPCDLTNSLREMGKAYGATLYMTLLAAFKVLLFRYSGQEDIIVGGVADGRRFPELRGMMGYLLDTFAIRTRPAAQLTFSAYLGQVKSALLGALDAADVPFERVVQALGIRRDLSHHPVFQTFFSFLPQASGFPAGWDMPPMDITVGAAKFSIYFEVDERPTYTAARIFYSTDLFDAETIQRMSRHWLTLLAAVCKTPDCALGDLALLTPEERELTLVQWNDRSHPVPATTIHGLVEEQAQRTPNAYAVQFETTTWTYAQLDQQAERLASHLRRSGAGPNTLVAICIDRSENLIAGLLAILKTGAAYLPLDPDTPRARILLCLEDASPVVVLTQRSLLEKLAASNTTMLVLEDILEADPLEPDNVSSGLGAGPDDIAYVIHTSGSTGRPKAVELRHRSVVNLLLSMQREPGFTSKDTLMAVKTVSFDIAVLELFLPLIAGGRVVIANRSAALDPWQLTSMIRSSGCTVMQATPATWSALIASGWTGHPGLRVLCGGEALTRVLADRLLALNLELWNVYGPTETTIWSTAHRVQAGEGPISIGRPIANTTTYILDVQQQPVPIGVPGELYIGGVGLAKGYRGQPDLTAQKFVTPAIANGERLYRTGDYAVYRADGTIECQGRADNQVKVRGYRIELEEVELHLSAHPRVAAAAARAWPDAAGGNRLSAYLVGKNGPPPDAAEIRGFLQSRVSDYMIPSDVVALDAMPLTVSGKFDRNALAPPQRSPRVRSGPLETEEEERLAKIWAEVLGIDHVGRDSNFFDLGGHSLLLVRLFARINKEFKANLPITTIFDTQTLSALAKMLRDNVKISSLVPVQTAGKKPPLFMVHSYLIYHGLSGALGNEQPFYGLRELPEDADESLEQRALRYIVDIQRVQPRGPYRIAGWCASGPLAMEIARQLILAGEEVALLLLFDSRLPGYAENAAHPARNAAPLKAFARKLAYHRPKFQNISALGMLKYLFSALRRRCKEARDRFYMRHWGTMSHISRTLKLPLPQFMYNSSLRMLQRMQEFRVEIIPVRLTLIRATDSRQASETSRAYGWERVAELGIEVLWAPGDHETMFRGNNLKATAKLVREALASAHTSVTAVQGASPIEVYMSPR